MSKIPAYKNENLSFEERAKDIVSRMDLLEKTSQMTHTFQPLRRL